MRTFARFTLVAGLLVALPVRAAVVDAVFGGRVPCVARDGVQFCEGSVATRVESWDGVPLDVNVTLPPAGQTGPFPLIINLHGWGEAKAPAPFTTEAQDGYVVVAYTARGFHESCGSAPSRVSDPGLTDPDVCTKRGWTHLADVRFEAHDAQYLAGLLVDEGLAIPDKIGATGVSYGGGQTMILAALRDRTMMPDGTLVPWQSPAGHAMRLAAAAPLVPWTDMAEALTPAGRTLDYRVDNPYGTRAGIQKQSYNGVLFSAGLSVGFYAPPGADPEADLTGWNARLALGEPYDGDPQLTFVLDQITHHHSAYYVDDTVPPAPLFIYNAWTDDLFPVDETVRFWRRTVARHPDAEIALNFANGFGHPRAALAGNIARVLARIHDFLALHLKGSGTAPPALEVYTEGCNGAPEGGPYTASSWDAIHPGEVRFAEKAARVYTSAGGSVANAKAVEPFAAGPCATVAADDDPGAATYRLPAASGAGYTLLGAPTVIANLAVRGNFAQVAARLWDVGTDGKQTLVSQSFYRPRGDGLGREVFQLHPNGWHLADGHLFKLELLGQSSPFGRVSNGSFKVTVSDLELRLPVLETPDGGTVQAPAATVLPPAAPEPLDLGPPACAASPDATCRGLAAAGKGALLVKKAGKSPDDTVVWKWRKAASTTKADFGQPLGSTAYRLCAYAGDGALVWNAVVPAGGTCTGKKAKPCWKERRNGFDYADPGRSPDGVAALTLHQGKKPTIVLHAAKKGLFATLGAQPLRLELRNGAVCWASAFATAPKQSSSKLQYRDAGH